MGAVFRRRMELILFTIPFMLISAIYGQNDTVASGPPTGLVLSRTGKVDVKDGEKLFTVKCSLTESTPGHKEAIYEWFDPNNQKITSLSTLQGRKVIKAAKNGGLYLMINDVTEDYDAGLYKCVATFGTEVYNATFTLKVIPTIKFKNCPVQQNALMGQEGTISCAADSSAVGTTWWEKGGMTLDLDDERYRVSASEGLIISNINDNDAGEYRYVAISGSESKAQTITLDVVVAPRILMPIQEGVAVAGKEHTLYCKADGRPLPTIYWFKEGTANALQTTERITVTTTQEGGKIQGILQFKPVEKEDDTIYTCKAVGIKLSDSDQTPLENSTSSRMIVHTLPTVNDMATVEKSENQGAELVCVAHGDPAPSAVWQKVGTDIQYSAGGNSEGITVTEKALEDASNPGTEVKLQFTQLKSENAGEYKCVAKNEAGDAENTVTLVVRYKPQFLSEDLGPFYTWQNHDEGFIVCVAKGDPSPTFSWYKLNDGNAVEVSSGQFYTMTREQDPNDKLKATGKLQVSYTGSNPEVFGTYRCVATNTVDKASRELTIQEGRAPEPPMVDERDRFAQRVVLWIRDQPVQGPPVKEYKITYMPPNSTRPQDLITLFKPKETRLFTDDQSGSPKTEVLIDNLVARTLYSFSVFAKNDVGTGGATVKELRTKALSVPAVVVIDNSPISSHATQINVRWRAPDNGGADILEYHLSCDEVAVKPSNATLNPQGGYQLLNPIKEVARIKGITTTQYLLDFKAGIRMGKYYMIKVYAVNGVGNGPPGEKIIKTKQDEGISTGAIIGIFIGAFIVLFIVVDVFCYFKSNCGVLMTIREAIGGGRGDEGYSAAKTDDVENLAKKDELTEEAKAAEENEMTDGQVNNDEKKEPLLSEEQKVDTVDEVSKPEEKVIEPEDKEEIKTDTETKPEEAPPSTEEKTEEPAVENTDNKPSESAQE